MWLILSSWDCGWQCHDVNCNWLCSWWNITEHVVAWTIANKSKKKINHPTVNMVLSVMPPCMLRNVKNSRSKQRKTRQDNPFTVETTTYFLLLSQQLQLNNTRTKLPRCIGDSCNQEQTTTYWQLVIWWSLMVMWGKVVVWFDVVVGITKSCDICETKLLFRFFHETRNSHARMQCSFWVTESKKICCDRFLVHDLCKNFTEAQWCRQGE